MDYKFCINCGCKLPKNAKFCTRCGTKQPLLNSNKPNSKQNVQNPKVSSNQSQSSDSEIKQNIDGEEYHSQYQQNQEQHPQQSVQNSKAPLNRSQNNNSHMDQNINRETYQAHHQQYQEQQFQQNNSYRAQQNYQVYNESENPNMINSFNIWMRNPFQVKVCMGRADYWWGFLDFSIFSIVLEIIASILASFNSSYSIAYFIILLILDIALFAISIIAGIIFISASIRRLHDTGRSGWNFCWSFIPIVGEIIFVIMTCQRTNWNSTEWPRP